MGGQPPEACDPAVRPSARGLYPHGLSLRSVGTIGASTLISCEISMTEPLHFGQEFWIINRNWAESWARFFPSYFERILSAYRERVTQYYSEEAQEYPDAYQAMGPVQVLAVASLVRIWIFVRPAENTPLRW
jgi:hypothetical protein